MKSSLKRTLSQTDREVSDLLIFGYSEKAIADELHLTLRTIQNSRLKLCKLFEADSIAILCQKIVEFGYADNFVASLPNMQERFQFPKLGMWEVIALHYLFDGQTYKDVIEILENERIQSESEELLENVKNKLKINDFGNVFFNALLSGYVHIIPLDPDDVKEETKKEVVKIWKREVEILKIPQYRFEKSFVPKNCKLE